MTTLIQEQPRTLILDCNHFELVTLADSLRMQSLDIVGQASDIDTALQLFRSIRPDTVIMNFQGCDHHCLEFLQTIRKLNPEVGIVLLTEAPDLRLYALREADLPVGTQLIEKSALNDLREIRSAVDSARLPGVKTQWAANIWNSAIGSLTDIQIETLRLLALGLSNSDIGKARFVSEKSVEQTITRIAIHLHVVHERGRNMRVVLASEYFKWLGAPREHAM